MTGRKRSFSDDELRHALSQSGGSRKGAAKILGVSAPAVVQRVTGELRREFPPSKGRTRTNRATDDRTSQILEMINGSGMTDQELTENALMSEKSIYWWRSGRAKVSNRLFKSVMRELGHEEGKLPPVQERC